MSREEGAMADVNRSIGGTCFKEILKPISVSPRYRPPIKKDLEHRLAPQLAAPGMVGLVHFTQRTVLKLKTLAQLRHNSRENCNFL